MPSAKRARVVANWNRSTGRPVWSVPTTVPRVVAGSSMSSCSSSRWRCSWAVCSSRELEHGRVDVEAGVNLDPGLAAILDGGDQDILDLGCGGLSTCRGGVKHGQPAHVAGAGCRLDPLGQLLRCDAASPWRPGALIDLAVFGLKLGPADGTLGGVEPEGPLRVIRRGDLVDAAEVAAFIRLSARAAAEVKLEEARLAGEVEPGEPCCAGLKRAHCAHA